MELSKTIDDTLIEAIKNAVEESAPDILSDMTTDNPDWWAGKIREVFEDTITKALKDKTLIKEVLLEILEEQVDSSMIYSIVEEIVEDIAKDILVNKITVEVKK